MIWLKIVTKPSDVLFDRFHQVPRVGKYESIDCRNFLHLQLTHY